MVGTRSVGDSQRWVQAIIALVIMVMISPYEYCFTIFESPIAKAHGWSLPSVAVTYTIYIVVAALFMIPSGYWSDRWQPRWFTTVAGIVTGLGWVMAATANSPTMLYIAYGLGALGPGYIYCNGVNNALKWFPESRGRGMAVGLIDMGFGLGSAIFIPILSGIIKTNGYRAAFSDMGWAMLVVIVILAQFLRFPEKGWFPSTYNAEEEAARIKRSNRGLSNAVKDFTPRETLATWQFWVSWLCLALICSGGLMVAGHVAEMGKDDVLVAGAAVGVTAAALSRIPNGVMRWVAGGISDYVGRTRLMFICFVICGLAMWALANVTSGAAFVILTLVVMGTWGPLFSLFPALVSDYWGRENSAINYGMVYTGKGAAGIFAGVIAAAVYASSGTWKVDFYLAGAFAILSGLGAILVLRRPDAKVPTVVDTHQAV